MKKPTGPGAERPDRDPVRSHRWIIPLILGVAFVVKLAVLFELRAHPLLQPRPDLDSGVYLDLARQVAAGDLLGGPRVFFVSPFYIYFVALVLTVSGGSVLAVQLAQVGLGVAAIWLVADTARRWFGNRGAWIAATLAAATGYFSFNEILVLQSAVDPVLTALGLWLLARAWSCGRPGTFVAAGAALGLHVLNRPNVLAWAVVAGVLTLAGPIMARTWRRAGSLLAAAPALALAGGLLLVLGPVALRNYAVAGEPAIVSSHGGLNFYIGNNARADGAYRLVAGITPAISGQTRDMRRVAESATGRTLTDTEASGWFLREALAWISQHPGAAASLFARKVAYVLNATDLPLNDSYAYYATDASAALRWLPVGPWLLLPLGLAGLWLGRPGRAAVRQVSLAWWRWTAFVPVYALSVAAFFVAGRYRMPLLIPLSVTAAGALLALWDRWRAGRRRALAVAVALVAVLFAATNVSLGLDDGLSAWRAEMVLYQIGAREDAAARALLARTVANYPNPALLLYRAGRAYLTRGDASEAVPLFERAFALAPDRPEVQLGLGQALVGAGRPADAVPWLREAMNAPGMSDIAAFDLARALAGGVAPAVAHGVLRDLPAPDRLAPASQLALGRAALDLGDAVVAEGFLARAAKLTPGNADAREGLGLAYALQGRRSDAVGEMEAACRLDPTHASAHLNLAILYAETGRRADARARAGEALRLQPGYQRARDFLAALDRGQGGRRSP